MRWNRAMEALYGRAPRRRCSAGRSTPSSPEAFLEALRGSLVLGDHEEIAHIYKLHLPSADGRSLMVNVSVAPFQAAPGRALRHDPDPRRHHRARAARGAAAARGEDGLGGPAGRRRRPRGEHTARRDLLLHAAPARPARGERPAPAGAREDREAELPRGQDHQRPAQLLALERHRVRQRRRQQGAGRRAVAGRAPARGLADPRAPRAGRSACRRCAATRTASSRCSST